MASRDTKDLHPELVKAWEWAKVEYTKLHPDKPQPFLTCTYRSNEEQNALYAQGRTLPGGKVTNAKGGESPHNYLPALAFDIAFKTKEGKVDWAPEHFKRFADVICPHFTFVEWGGSWAKFPDKPHFQHFGWVKMRKK
jgi:peptidoglycan L-alanyl-D-glutamate endopeptidase CwlK